MKVALRTLSLPLLLASGPLVSQVPADAVLRDFEPAGAIAMELGGETLDRAEVFFSERAVAYLVIAPELESALLISPRSGAVEGIDPAMLEVRSDGTVDVLASAVLTPLGTFEIDAATQAVRFQLGGAPAELEPKPSLTGMHTAESLRDHDPAYAFEAARYEPAPAPLAGLRRVEREVHVLVYFGSWCPICSRLVPRILRVAQELEGSTIRFEYYGLPQPLTDDPIAKREGVHGVPTAVVVVDGKETARLTAGALGAPEQALADVLGV